MPTTLEQWYEWALKLDWQYCQEQAELKLVLEMVDLSPTAMVEAALVIE